MTISSPERRRVHPSERALPTSYTFSRDLLFAEQSVAHHLDGEAQLLEISADARIDPRVRAEAARFAAELEPETAALVAWLQSRGYDSVTDREGSLCSLHSVGTLKGKELTLGILDLWDMNLMAGVTRCLNLLLFQRTSEVGQIARRLVAKKEACLERVRELREEIAD
ncbi:hypothetical protein [Demequina sp. NBRC 110055]|uniref:hypothetical protein n=1 Tax=Demequina sp. NBRC 110055 TaxID=1570344 RepID=UPI000A0498AF|nr:hypothetical protein [Demequina sp. NBRC 110055]